MSILATARQAGPRTLLSTVSRNVGLAPARPWLPAGATLGGRLFGRGLDPAVGVAWLDEVGVLDARVRLTYAPARPGGALAATSLALRLQHPDGGDAAERGAGLGDLVLRAGPRPRWVTGRRRSVHPGPVQLLVSGLPYVVAGRPVALAARACGAETFELSCAVGDQPWREFADLRVCPLPVAGDQLDADPVAHLLPGLDLDRPRAGRAG